MKKIRGIAALPKDACYDDMASPVGTLTIIASSQGLHAVLWENDLEDSKYLKIIKSLKKVVQNDVISQTKKQLSEYFQGKRRKFDLPLKMNGTEFQLQVWKQLLKISYGKTISYGEQAERMGDKNKARAVGMANGLNPISIIVPCHRVIGRNGHLVGFGGGLEKKAYLLKLEEDF